MKKKNKGFGKIRQNKGLVTIYGEGGGATKSAGWGASEVLPLQTGAGGQEKF